MNFLDPSPSQRGVHGFLRFLRFLRFFYPPSVVKIVQWIPNANRSTPIAPGGLRVECASLMAPARWIIPSSSKPFRPCCPRAVSGPYHQWPRVSPYSRRCSWPSTIPTNATGSSQNLPIPQTLSGPPSWPTIAFNLSFLFQHLFLF